MITVLSEEIPLPRLLNPFYFPLTVNVRGSVPYTESPDCQDGSWIHDDARLL